MPRSSSIGGKRILFDTGNNSDLLAQNAKAKGIDLSKVDFVVHVAPPRRSHGRHGLSPERESQGF